MIPRAESLTFHVIYTRGTVSALLPFVTTLLAHSTSHFCLVANGCDASEESLLDARCRQEPRLSWRSLPGRSAHSHAATLNHLYRTTEGRHFCFMDSDIFATGDFTRDLLPPLATAAVVCSGWPITVTQDEQILAPECPMVLGYHRITAAGDPLGGSYCCICTRESIAIALREFPAGFERAYWRELRPRIKAFIARGIGPRLFFDTGRVLFQVIRGQGCQVLAVESPNLVHLGSFSVHTRHTRIRDARPMASPHRTADMLRSCLVRLLRALRSLSGRQRHRSSVDRQVAEDAIYSRIHGRRIVIEPFYVRLLRAATMAAPWPDPPVIAEPEVRDQLDRLVQALRTEPSLAGTLPPAT